VPEPRQDQTTEEESPDLFGLSADELAARLPAPPDTATLVAHYLDLAGISERDITIDGRHGPVPARHYLAPGRDPLALVMWVHGGAFFMGDLDMPESHWVGLTLAAQGFAVLAVDYQKCLDGVHFPTPSDDVLDAWLWAVAHAEELGGAGLTLHLAGASAGGTLTAGVTKRLRDGAGPLPTSLVLIYPMLHAHLPPVKAEIEDAVTRLSALAIGPDVCERINKEYSGSEDVLLDPYAFAANGDLSGQPPVYILNSEADYLRASGEHYGEALAAAGVPVTMELELDCQHGQLNGPFEAAGERSLKRMVAWLRTHA
jgi:acetyl esterase